MKSVGSFAFLAAIALGTSPALAEDKGGTPTDVVVRTAVRAPVTAAPARATELSMDRYHNSVTIVRERTSGNVLATFVAEPRLLDRGLVMVFEAVSVAATGTIPRWRCIAITDVAECLGRPLRLRYLPADERITLKATLKPASELPSLLASR